MPGERERRWQPLRIARVHIVRAGQAWQRKKERETQERMVKINETKKFMHASSLFFTREKRVKIMREHEAEDCDVVPLIGLLGLCFV